MAKKTQKPKKETKKKTPEKEVKKPDYVGKPISEHISWKEAVESATAKRLHIDNTPPPEVLEKMKITAEKIFEPLRKFWKYPIAIDSFYRCPELNKALKGAKNSQHMKGEAIDIDAQIYGHISNRQVFEYIANELVFDQLIWEFGDDSEPEWVHASYKDKNPRREIMRSRKVNGKVKYEKMYQ